MLNKFFKRKENNKNGNEYERKHRCERKHEHK